MAGVYVQNTLGLASFIASRSSRLARLTTEGITEDCAVVKASMAPWVTMILCAVQPAVVCSPAFRPVAASVEAIAPRPCHEPSVATVLAAESPIASSWWAVSVTQTKLLLTTDAGEPASKIAAMVSGGPVHRGSPATLVPLA